MNIKKILSFTCSTIAMLLVSTDLDGATMEVNLNATNTTFSVGYIVGDATKNIDGNYDLDISNGCKYVEFSINGDCDINITSGINGPITSTTTKKINDVDKTVLLSNLWNSDRTKSVQYVISCFDAPVNDGLIHMTGESVVFDFELLDKNDVNMRCGVPYYDTLIFTFTASTGSGGGGPG